MKGLSEKVAASGFVVALVLLGGVGTSSYLSMRKLIENKQGIIRNYEVLEALSNTFEGIIDAERGRRGYLISRQKIHLETYNNGVQKADTTLKALQKLTDSNPTQQHRLKDLKLLVAKRLAILKRSINLLEQNQFDAAMQINLTDRGWEAQQKIRASMQIIDQEEQRLLKARIAATGNIVRQTIIIVVTVGCLSFSLLLGVYLLLQKQINIRRRTEVALQKREEQLETERSRWVAIASNMTEGLIVADFAGNILTMNPAALHLYEYQNIQQAPKNLRELDIVFEAHFLDGRLLPIEEYPLAMALQGETFFNYEIYLKRVDTGTSWFGRYSSKPVYNSAGEIILRILTMSDISKRMQVNEELRQNEQRYRSLILATSQIVWNTPDDGGFATEQPNWSAFTGQTFSELKNFGWLNAVHPEDRHCTEQVWRKAVLNRTLYEVEYRLRRYDGEYRNVAVRGVPIQQPDGSIREWIGICTDIDDRKRTEVALQKAHDELEMRVQERTADLRQSERRYRCLVLATSDIVWTTNAAGDVVDDLPAWRQLTGQSAAEIKGSGQFAAVHPLDQERTAQLWSYAVKMKRTFKIEHRVRLANGTYRFFLGCGVPVPDDNGAIQEWIGTHIDITERKQIELTLRQAKEELEVKVQQRTAELQKLNEELRRSNQELEQFAYVASHDLQEPLRAVTGYTQLLVQDYENLLDESALEYTGYIVDGAKRMQQLIQDLLIYSRVGTCDLKLAATDCNTVMSQVLNNLQVAIAESNAIISHDPLPTVVADKTQVMQLFQNLIGNAIKFCREETPKIHISAVRGDGETKGMGGYTPLNKECLFTICDNGIGIKPQYLERIFEVFKRLHTRREFPGTGIGLAICKKIVERHGGHIWVESQPKVGTSFYFTLPPYEHSDV